MSCCQLNETVLEKVYYDSILLNYVYLIEKELGGVRFII